MVLKELKLKDSPICKCHNCCGTGIAFVDFDNNGTVCTHCNGTGYEHILQNDNFKLYIDEDTNIIYEVANVEIPGKFVKGEIIRSTEFFDGLVDIRKFDKVCDIEQLHIMQYEVYHQYKSFHFQPASVFKMLGVTSEQIILYDMFANGFVPASLNGKMTLKESYNLNVNSYEITSQKIVLDRLNDDETVNCNCPHCGGTGIDEFINKIGVICLACNGTGYLQYSNDNQQYVAIDNGTKTAYFINDNEKSEKPHVISNRAHLFNGLVETSDFQYVLYDNAVNRFEVIDNFSYNSFINLGLNKDEIISYRKFLMGRIPLPPKKYSCPKTLSINEFDNNCTILYEHCSKFGTGECWKIFYGNAKTAGERLEVLRKMKKI